MVTEPRILVGRYALLETVGSGASGHLWRGHDASLDRVVAVKVVNLADQPDPMAEERFRREARAAAGIHHPNVVSVFDAGVDQKSAYLVMELLDGPSVATILKYQGPMPWDRGLAVIEGVAKGLSAVHAAGITHRDIKPGNVVLHGGEPKIVDFGIAQLAEGGNQTLTAPAMAIGTAAFMSPEQALGSAVSSASDLYSLGCLIFAIFTGDGPFRAPAAVAVARAHVSDQPPRLSSLRPDTPPALDDLVDRLLRKEPGARPGTAEVAALAAQLLRDAPATTALLKPLPPALPPAGGTRVMPATRQEPAVAPPATAALPVVPTSPAPPEPTGQGSGKGKWVGVGLAVLLASTLLAWGVSQSGLFNQPTPTPVTTTVTAPASPTTRTTSAAPTTARTTSAPPTTATTARTTSAATKATTTARTTSAVPTTASAAPPTTGTTQPTTQPPTASATTTDRETGTGTGRGNERNTTGGLPTGNG